MTTTFENDFQVDAWELVKHRYDQWEVSEPYEDLQEHAYDIRNLQDWQRALAAVNDPSSSQFDHALADLLYWYTETTGAIPDEIKPRVYATAEALYRETDNTYMADAAEYRVCLTEGIHQRENESFENARVEFFQANSISGERASPPFDEVKAFLESVLTDIAEYREQGKFMEAYEKAEYGHTELTEGAYQDADTGDAEILLDGWKHDMQAQHQRANGQFEEAIKTTNEAIADFRSVGADGLAQTAQTRRYQIQAIMAQLEPDFDKAANHHRSAREESTSGKTAHLHAVETELCLVKKHVTVRIVPEGEWTHGEAKGICEQLSIVDVQPIVEVRDRDNDADLARTLIHEYAHAMLHFDVDDDTERSKREVEAEAVAYVVGRYCGLDTRGSAFYLAAWESDDPAVVRDRLGRISRTAEELIDVLED